MRRICVVKGHFDKSSELRWAQGNFLAKWGLPELLKHFSEASENHVIPGRAPAGSMAPGRTAVLGTGPAPLAGAAPLPAASDSPASGQWVLPLAWGVGGFEERGWAASGSLVLDVRVPPSAGGATDPSGTAPQGLPGPTWRPSSGDLSCSPSPGVGRLL